MNMIPNHPSVLAATWKAAVGCGEARIVTGCPGYLRFFLNHEPHLQHYLQLSALAPFILLT